MDENERANRRLVDLGYERYEAHVERAGVGRVQLRGELVAGVDLDPGDLPRLLEMFPPKMYLLLMRHWLGGD